MSETDDLVLAHFGLTGRERTDRQVACPFHEDTRPSASINVQKRLLHCFTCGEGWNFEQVAERLSAHVEESNGGVLDTAAEAPVPPPALSLSDEELAHQHVAERGYTLEELAQFVDISLGVEGVPKYDGYLVLERDGLVVARNLRDDDRARYLNPPGNKRVFWVTDLPAPGAPVWITEGVWDAIALAALGTEGVGATLGSSVSEPQAYELQGRTVFVVYDADAAGWKGAKETAQTLTEFGARPLVVPYPRELGKDPGEAYANAKGKLKAWLEKVKGEYGQTDESYVMRTLRGGDAVMNLVPTTLSKYDELLGGGFRDGVHTIAAEPGVGKTSFALWLAKTSAHAGKRTLYITYEISKRQCWARFASMYAEQPWSEIEREPTIVDEHTQQAMLRLAGSVRVAVGWSVEQVAHAAGDYDVVVVDYLQRMPGPFGENESRMNVAHNITRLSDIARDKGKVVLVISSMPRAEYGKVSMRGLKEAGEIEYVSQSVTMFLSESAGKVLVAQVVKNTRGQRGTFWLAPDLGHQTFTETRPPGRGG